MEGTRGQRKTTSEYAGHTFQNYEKLPEWEGEREEREG